MLQIQLLKEADAWSLLETQVGCTKVGMPGQEVGTHHLSPFLFPSEERLSWFVWLLHTCREITDSFAGCWNNGSSLHEVRLQPGCPGMGLSSAEPLRSLGTCWPVNSGLFPPRKPFRPNPGHFSAVFLTSAQPSTSLLGSLPRFVLFFLIPPPGSWSSISCLPQAGAASTSEITKSGGLAALQTGSKEEQGPTKSLMRWFYQSIDHPSATHGVWHNYPIWFPLLRWHPAEVTAAFQKYRPPRALQHPSPATAQASPESHCYRRMKGISQNHFSISEV